jgi:hypothetical protein
MSILPFIFPISLIVRCNVWRITVIFGEEIINQHSKDAYNKIILTVIKFWGAILDATAGMYNMDRYGLILVLGIKY